MNYKPAVNGIIDAHKSNRFLSMSNRFRCKLFLAPGLLLGQVHLRQPYMRFQTSNIEPYRLDNKLDKSRPCVALETVIFVLHSLWVSLRSKSKLRVLFYSIQRYIYVLYMSTQTYLVSCYMMSAR